MQKYVTKAARLKQPKCISVPLRGEVHEFLRCAAAEVSCPITTLIRGILEEFYDQHFSEVINDG